MTPDDYNRRELADGHISPVHLTILTLQYQQEHGLAVDGKCGPVTRGHILRGRAGSEVHRVGTGWAPFKGPLEKIPVGREQMVEVYGDPKPMRVSGKLLVDPRWSHAWGVTIPASRIPGYNRRLWVHKLVEPYFIEAMRRSVAVAPGYHFDVIGCFNPRHQRHDRSRPLSDHTWAIAFDVNPQRNPGQVPRMGDPEPFEPGWERYSDLPREVVEAWESVGFEWGGRWTGYRDPMHFSLRKT